MVIQNKNIYSHTEYSLNVMKCELTADNKKTVKTKQSQQNVKFLYFSLLL